MHSHANATPSHHIVQYIHESEGNGILNNILSANFNQRESKLLFKNKLLRRHSVGRLQTKIQLLCRAVS